MNGELTHHAHHHDRLTCVPVSLEPHLIVPAARTAISINGRNSPHPVAAAALGLAGSPLERSPMMMRIAVVTQKYWHAGGARLAVFFMDNPPVALRAKILGHMNAWSTACNVRFSETNSAPDAQVRIARGGGSTGGYWSYIGTDILHIPQDRQTMNLEGFTMHTEDSEFFRVVRHETGHTLGCPHEHMRRDLIDLIDEEKAIAYFQATQGWNETMTRDQVLTPLDQASVMGTPRSDATSIMCYQIPGAITKSGRPILGGTDIDATDYSFMATIYPRQADGGGRPMPQANALSGRAGAPASSPTEAASRAGHPEAAPIHVKLPTGIEVDLPAATVPDILDRIFGDRRDGAPSRPGPDRASGDDGASEARQDDADDELDHGPSTSPAPAVPSTTARAAAPQQPPSPPPATAGSHVGPYAAKHYSRVQLIAYELPTLAVTPLQGTVSAVPRLPVSMLPRIDDHDSQDGFSRLRRLAGVVDAAAKALQRSGKDDVQTLKVFMAPEFFFRPQNKLNAYSFNQGLEILTALRQMFSHVDFKDWLFVPGTIFSCQPANAKDDSDPRRAYFNTACLIKGGAVDAPFSFVHKRLVSTIDGAPPNEAALHNPHFQPILDDWAERKNNVFRCDGITFGVEVCLDHIVGLHVLKGVLHDWQQHQSEKAPPIDVHLLTSCGMEFNVRSSASRADGYLLGVDGHPYPRSYNGHSQVARVRQQDIDGEAVFETTDVHGHALSLPLWSEVLTGDLQAAAQGASGPPYPQRVVCYGALPF